MLDVFSVSMGVLVALALAVVVIYFYLQDIRKNSMRSCVIFP